MDYEADRFRTGRTDKSYSVVGNKTIQFTSHTPTDKSKQRSAETPTNDGQIEEVRVLIPSSLGLLDSTSIFSHTNHNQSKKAHRNGIKKPKSAGRTRSSKGVRW
jgi:hypothetical protein